MVHTEILLEGLNILEYLVYCNICLPLRSVECSVCITRSALKFHYLHDHLKTYCRSEAKKHTHTHNEINPKKDVCLKAMWDNRDTRPEWLRICLCIYIYIFMFLFVFNVFVPVFYEGTR
jgi:hypothetical protein